MQWAFKTSLNNIGEPLLPFPYVNCTSPGINITKILLENNRQRVANIYECCWKLVHSMGDNSTWLEIWPLPVTITNLSIP